MHTFAKMIKKQIYIYFLFTACFLQLGHSFFPHTHIKAHHHNGKHHHHQEQSSEQNGISLLFSHFNHSSDSFSNSHLEEVVTIAREVPHQIQVFERYHFSSKSFEFYTNRKLARNQEPFIFISPHLYSLQFRGPPTFFS